MHRTDTTDSTSLGVVKTGGISTISSGIISGLTVATDINVLDWVTMDKGFDTQRYKVLSTAAGQITVDGVATSSETGITVTVVANMYTQGDGVAVNRAIYGPDQANAVQEELVNLIVASGQSLDKQDNRQLQNAVVPVSGGTFTGPVAVTGALSATASISAAINVQASQDVNATRHVNAVQNVVAAGSVQGLNKILTKTITNTGADTTRNIKMFGGKFEHASLANNTQIKLFDFATALGVLELIQVEIDYVYTQAGVFHGKFKFNTMIPAGGDKIFIRTPSTVQNQDSDTPDDIGQVFTYLFSNGADASLDGANGRNNVPLFIIKEGSINLRNSHNTNTFTLIQAFIKITRNG